MRSKYVALLWPLVGGVVMVVLQAYNVATTDGRVDASEWVTVFIQGFSLVMIWCAANVPDFDKAKAWVSAVMLGLNMLVSFVVGGLDGNEISQLVIAVLATAGVFIAPGPVKTVTARVVTPQRPR